MPRHSHTDPVENMLVAKRRDLAPLLEESIEALECDEYEAETIEALLSKAWRVGVELGQTDALAELGAEVEVQEADVEAELEPLLREFLGSFHLSVQSMFAGATLLSQALVAGVRSAQTETMALAIEYSHDLNAEALAWLEQREEGPEQEPPKPSG